ncbi:MAG: ECF transporter S component [Candidatus Cloacimonadaceae bacterium]|nr:ECF transporter S component [Candidatus Cloacimonadaceae bacterium]MDP3114846.1 ECF transporter S component [Candidatus Cloacimonadaceae bacterium]
MLARFSTKDLILIATLAGIGIAIKPIVSPLSKMISTPLMIPGGSIAGGFYMMWLVLAVMMTKKIGTGTLFGFLQALIVLVVGIQGNQGMLSLLSYTLPGIVVDLLYFILRKRDKLGVHLLLCACANITGAMVVAVLLFRHPLPIAVWIGALALASGIVGGYASFGVLKALRETGLTT